MYVNITDLELDKQLTVLEGKYATLKTYKGKSSLKDPKNDKTVLAILGLSSKKQQTQAKIDKLNAEALKILLGGAQ